MAARAEDGLVPYDGEAPAEIAEGDAADIAKGYFVLPTVFADVKDDMRIAQEEIFGPVISAIAFDDVDEVITRGNATTFGLGSGVWTRDVTKAHRLAKDRPSRACNAAAAIVAAAASRAQVTLASAVLTTE